MNGYNVIAILFELTKEVSAIIMSELLFVFTENECRYVENASQMNKWYCIPPRHISGKGTTSTWTILPGIKAVGDKNFL